MKYIYQCILKVLRIFSNLVPIFHFIASLSLISFDQCHSFASPPPVIFGLHSRTVLGTLTEAGGFWGIPLAQLGAVADVSALQHEASVAAVVEHRALHWRPRRLGGHPAVLQGRPHSWTQQHCKNSKTAQDVS